MNVEQAPHMPEDLATLHSHLAEQEAKDADEKSVGPDMYAREVVDDLNQKVLIDEKTGVGTRAALDVRMEGLKKNRKQNIGILFVDGNEFKQVNDEVSYDHGDNYIRRLGHMLDDHTDKKRTKIFRWGGDEFVIILEDMQSVEQLDAVGKRLTTFFRGGNEEVGEAIIPTISIGGVFIGQEAADTTLEHALFYAEIAMKTTKLQGKTDIKKNTGKIQQVTTMFHTDNNTIVPLKFSPSSYMRYQESTPHLLSSLSLAK